MVSVKMEMSYNNYVQKIKMPLTNWQQILYPDLVAYE